MKFNAKIWNFIKKHTQFYGSTWATLVHDKHNGTMYVYDILANRKRSIEYMLDLAFLRGNIGSYMTTEEIQELYAELNKELKTRFERAI